MLNLVRSDIEDDLLSVSGILLRHGFPPLLGVSYEIHEIPEIDYSNDIRSAIDSILAAASPNTSKLASIAINAIKTIPHPLNVSGVASSAGLGSALESQCRALKEQLEQRPCHEALRKIRDLLSVISEKWSIQKVSLMKAFEGYLPADYLLWTLVECAGHVLEEQRERNRRFDLSGDLRGLLDEYSDIVLYGYSRQVLHILSRHYSKPLKTKQYVHVLECRTKTLYSSSGSILYLDGLRYAEKISSEMSNYKRLSIEPDMALGHIISKAVDNSGRVAILMGTNAVYINGTFRHSMGHLAVAATAKSRCWEKSCDVIVATDGMKIGKKAIEKSQQRNPGAWLTPDREVLRRLEVQGIELYNWQEDMIPREFVDKLVILDAGEVLEIGPDIDLETRIEEYVFDGAERYCALLEHKVLAAMLDRCNGQISPMKENLIGVLEGCPKPRDLANWILAGIYLNQNDVEEYLDSLMREKDVPSVEGLTSFVLSHQGSIVEEIAKIWEGGTAPCREAVLAFAEAIRGARV